MSEVNIPAYIERAFTRAHNSNITETDKFISSIHEASFNNYTSIPLEASRLLNSNPHIYKPLFTALVMLNELVPPTPYSSTILSPDFSTFKVSEDLYGDIRSIYQDIYGKKFTKKQMSIKFQSMPAIVQKVVDLVSNGSFTKIDTEFTYSNLSSIYLKTVTHLTSTSQLKALGYLPTEEDKVMTTKVSITSLDSMMFVVETKARGFKLVIGSIVNGKVTVNEDIPASLLESVRDALDGNKFVQVLFMYRKVEKYHKIIPIAKIWKEKHSSTGSCIEMPLSLNIPKNVFVESHKPVYNTTFSNTKTGIAKTLKALEDIDNLDDVYLIHNRFEHLGSTKRVTHYTVAIKDFYVDGGELKGVSYRRPAGLSKVLIHARRRGSLKEDEIFLCEITDEVLTSGLQAISIVLEVNTYTTPIGMVQTVTPSRITTNKSLTCIVCGGIFFDKSAKERIVCNKCNGKLHHFLSNITMDEGILFAKEFVANTDTEDYCEVVSNNNPFYNSSSDAFTLQSKFNMSNYRVFINTLYLDMDDRRVVTIKFTKVKPNRPIHKPLPLDVTSFKFKYYTEVEIAKVASDDMLKNTPSSKWEPRRFKIGKRVY